MRRGELTPEEFLIEKKRQNEEMKEKLEERTNEKTKIYW